MRILTAEEMREVDRYAMEELGIPGLVLMENAAIGVADTLGESFPEARDVAIFCGPGNNGGDGLALARHLELRGYACKIFLVAASADLHGDAAVQLEILQKAEFEILEILPDSDLTSAVAVAQRSDLWVDALFGTGLRRPLEGHFAQLVTQLNDLRTPCLAVDLPSGLSGGMSEIPGVHVSAHVTVTFAAPKIAHIFAPAADAVGTIVVTDLGIPGFVVEQAHVMGHEGRLYLLTERDLAACLPRRAPDSHKGTYGHALIVAGSPGKTGAAILAAQAAVRSGAGLVTAAVPKPILAAVDAGSLESMAIALPAADDGALGLKAADATMLIGEGKQAVAIGPGLGTSDGTFEAIWQMVGALQQPMVLDADGINAFASRVEGISERDAPTVLTPHPGEMGRLLGIPTSEVQADRIRAVRHAAEESHAVVLLKGRQTLIGEPDGTVWVCPTGNPGMATGGTGDVLTGLVVGFLAQGFDASPATRLAAYLHGAAGDLAAEITGYEALRARDLLEMLPQAFARLQEA